jgi:hypothetical protein
MSKLKEWLSFPSTWKGIITGLSLIGVTFAPEQAEAIATAGIALVAAIWTFFSDSDVKGG